MALFISEKTFLISSRFGTTKAKVLVSKQFLKEELVSHWIGQVILLHNEYYNLSPVPLLQFIFLTTRYIINWIFRSSDQVYAPTTPYGHIR